MSTAPLDMIMYVRFCLCAVAFSAQTGGGTGTRALVRASFAPIDVSRVVHQKISVTDAHGEFDGRIAASTKDPSSPIETLLAVVCCMLLYLRVGRCIASEKDSGSPIEGRPDAATSVRSRVRTCVCELACVCWGRRPRASKCPRAKGVGIGRVSGGAGRNDVHEDVHFVHLTDSLCRET